MQLGFGSSIEIPSLADVWTTDTIYYVDATYASRSRVPGLISALTQLSGLSPEQESRLKPLASSEDVQRACPSNFNLISECFAVLIFDYVPSGPTDPYPLQYTIRIDGGRTAVDVEKHTSDYERVALPVQWAVDRAGMEIMGVQGVEVPREQPFTKKTNEEAKLNRRLCECRPRGVAVVLILGSLSGYHRGLARVCLVCRVLGCRVSARGCDCRGAGEQACQFDARYGMWPCCSYCVCPHIILDASRLTL